MTAITLNNLPAKFRPYFLTEALHDIRIKEEIDGIFQNLGHSSSPLEKIDDHVSANARWVIKSAKPNRVATPDSYLYRIRKAEKLRAYIQQNNLGDHVVVPRKYLYWHETQGQFYIVAERLELSSEVAELAFPQEAAIFRTTPGAIGQRKARNDGAPTRSFTPIQAKALAEMATLGYTDLTYNNSYFTPDGKVAILDTEPLLRWVKKTQKEKPIMFFFGEKIHLLSTMTITGIAKLKSQVTNPEALRAVQRVETKHVLRTISLLAAKLFGLVSAIYFAPAAAARIPNASLAKVLKVSFMAIGSIKVLVLAVNILSLGSMWRLSCGGHEGIQALHNREHAELLGYARFSRYAQLPRALN